MGTASKWLNYEAQMDANKKYLQGVQETNQTNRELAEKQNQWNLEQWNRENEYNDPKAQAARLQGAGLSAAATAQAVGNVPASPLQSANLANQVAPGPVQAPRLDETSLLQILREVNSLKSEMLDTQMKEDQSSLLPSFLLTDLDVRRTTAKQTALDYNKSLQLFPYNVQALRADIAYKNSAARNYDANSELARANKERVVQEFNFAFKLNDAQLKQYAQDLANAVELQKKIQAETSKVKQDTATSKAQEGVLDSQKELNVALKGESEERKFSIELDNIDKKFGSPSTTTQRFASMLTEGVISEKELYDNLIMMNTYRQFGQEYADKHPEFKIFLSEFYDEARSQRGAKNPSQLAPWLDALENVFGLPPFGN